MSRTAASTAAQLSPDACAGGLVASRIALGNHWLVLQQTAGGGLLRVVGPDGATPLEVAITPAGPVLRLRAGLAITADGPLSLTAEAIALDGRKGVSISSGGDVVLRANDDVRLNGERIKLNC